MSMHGRGAVRYTTVGSGQLLSDFEILCGLREAGLEIASIVAVDQNYARAEEVPSSTSKQSQAEEDGKEGGKARAPSEDDRRRATEALSQLAAFFAPTPVLAFSSLDKLQSAAALEPDAYSTTTFVQCDAPLAQDQVHRAASRILMEGGHMFQLSNLGSAGRRDDDEDHHGSSESGDRRHGGKLHRQYLRAQLRDGHAIEAWRRSETVLVNVPGMKLAEDDGARTERHAHARRWLDSSMRETAVASQLRIYKVVYFDKAKGRHTVAVRDGPSRSHKIVSVRHRGDEMLVAEEHAGWVRLSEEDDEWGWHLHTIKKDGEGATREGWMLIDGAEVGLGRLLECTWQPSSAITA